MHALQVLDQVWHAASNGFAMEDAGLAIDDIRVLWCTQVEATIKEEGLGPTVWWEQAAEDMAEEDGCAA